MPEKRKKIGIGLLGSGTVGQAVQDFVFEDSKKELDVELEIVKIYTRKPKGKKWYASRPSLFTTKAEEVIDHQDADIIIEALGFQEEKELARFKDLIVAALRKGKAVVTSDKAVLANYGAEIREAARKYGGELRFEACVAGGVPIIRSITESFAAEEPEAIYGIVNGTCNYILSEMGRGKSYEAALKEAQDRGYAETNPSADTSGKDAEAKLVLLAAVTFALQAKPGVFWRKGIEEIHALDFLYAGRKGRSTIKHIAVARRENGSVQAFVSPVLVPQEHFLAGIDGATNALFFKGRKSGGERGRDWNYVFAGPGAGGGPTAVAILGDVYDVARRGLKRSAPGALMKPGALKIQAEDEIGGCFYLRFIVKDRAGIVGDICQTLGEGGINISEIWQLSHGREELDALARRYRIAEKSKGILPFVITLERASIGQIKNAMKVIGARDYMLAEPLWFPIWTA